MKINISKLFKNSNNENLKEIIIKDFWMFIEKYKYSLILSLDNNIIQDKSLLDKLMYNLKNNINNLSNEHTDYNNIVYDTNLTYKNCIYLDNDMYIIKKFVDKFMDDNETWDIKMDKNFLIIPLNIILKNMGVTMEELLKYNK